MKPRVMAELLAQYVDRVIMGRDDTGAYLSLFHNHRRELAPLFAAVKLLRASFVKVEPSPTFVESLGVGLRVAAQKAILEREEETRPWTMPASRRTVVLGAAALGSLAAILMLTRAKVTPPTNTAA
jgi:hypothetical protein